MRVALRIAGSFAAALLLFAPRPGARAAPAGPSPPGIATEAKHALVIEAETGTVLLSKAADQPFPPASMAKMMTAYVVFGMLKDGRAKLTDTLPVSREAWRLGGSKMFVPIGKRVPIDDLLQGVIVDSGNDACLVLAQGLAGSEPGFAALMNRAAKRIGLRDSHFANVTGLPDPDERMSARDLATLALHTIRDFPHYYHYYGEKEFTFSNIKQGNRNPLLYADIGADGLKTGHTQESGFSLTASVKSGKRRIVLVLSGLRTSRARARESERVARWALRAFKDYRLFRPGETVVDAPVWLGADGRVPLTVDKDLTVTLSRTARPDMKVVARYDSPIPAPVRKGERVGDVTVTAPGATPVTVPLVAAAGVTRLGAFGRAAMLAGHLIWGKR